MGIGKVGRRVRGADRQERKGDPMSRAPRFEPGFAETAGRSGGQVVGTYDTYLEAERAVDRLADSGFPVERTEIVGRELRVVEQVTGRMTSGRAAAAGAGAGAWWGLLIGLLVGLFTTGPAWLGLIIGGLLIGAAWGAIFGFVAHRATGGRRDFSSTSGIVASRYDVTVPDEHVERARELLSGLPFAQPTPARPDRTMT
jgi:heat induced stress protein YflT